MRERPVGAAADLPPGSLVGSGQWAVGNAGGERFAVTRRCRHLGADLAGGLLEDDGRDGTCLVCPWHGAAYDPRTGRMTRGPGGAFARVPGLGLAVRALTRVAPLGRADVTEREGQVLVRPRRRASL